MNTTNFKEQLDRLSWMLRDNRHVLATMAEAFAVTGNETVAAKLFDIANDLVSHDQAINKAFSDMPSAGLAEAQRGLGNALTAALNAGDKKRSKK